MFAIAMSISNPYQFLKTQALLTAAGRQRFLRSQVSRLVVSRCLSLTRFCSERGWLLRLGLLPWHDSDHHSSFILVLFSKFGLHIEPDDMVAAVLSYHSDPVDA